MTRYVKPSGGRKGEIAESLMEAGDGIAFTAISLMASTVLTICAAMAAVASLWWLLLLLPIAFPVTTWITYFSSTAKLGQGDYGLDNMYYSSLKAYNRTAGDHTEQLARPILDKVFEHAQAKHNGGNCSPYDDYKDCTICNERLQVLNQLAPAKKSVDSKDDIELAKQFLAARKELTGA